ncbi:MAG TPA: signal recognition particle-docking protein FtsY [Vicinamibacterales bacterium]|nr:signal recognition particle-docking protein FtsY [Vicinamibacterales bacterium]
MGLFDKLKQGLQKTSQQLKDRLDRLDEMVGLAGPAEATAKQIDVETADQLEELLLMADVGVAASSEIVEAVRRPRRGESLRDLVKQEMLRILESADAARSAEAANNHAAKVDLSVILVVGVNGVGKTTTIGKLAHQMREDGKKPLICAADTFRAAAVDQLQIWAERAGVDIVRAKEGSDPAAVVFDAMTTAKTKNRDVVLVDTAGRLHTRTNLMNELDKIRRVAAREVPGAPHEVLLVLDATVGQNGLAQAREFTNVAGVTGIVLTKLDGTAKGGIAVAIAHDLKLPIRYVGVGEAVDDLLPFSPREYVDAIFTEKW